MKNITLEGAARLVGCTKTAWCDWELGRRIPNRTFMPLVCAAMGLEPNDFYPRAEGDAELARKAA